eukprot:4064751-Karenia_brevis.AAC.1
MEAVRAAQARQLIASDVQAMMVETLLARRQTSTNFREDCRDLDCVSSSSDGAESCVSISSSDSDVEFVAQ